MAYEVLFGDDKFETFEMSVVDLLMTPGGCPIGVELEVIDDTFTEGEPHGVDNAGQEYRVTGIVFEVTPIKKK